MDESGFSIGSINAYRVIINTQIKHRYQAKPKMSGMGFGDRMHLYKRNLNFSNDHF
jgi:hypothetical protein